MKSSWASIQWLVLLIATTTSPCQAVRRRARGNYLPKDTGNDLPEEKPTRVLYRKGKGSRKGYGKGNRRSTDSGDNIFDHGETAVILREEDQYLAFCQEQLLSDNVERGGLISQKDIANFAKTLCGIFDDEDVPELSCPTPEFSNLSVEVQLLFVWFICPQDDDLSVISCLGSYLISGNDFGYELNSSTEEDTANDVLGFCCSLIPKLARANLEPLTVDTCPDNLPSFNLDSPSPTERPTQSPTLRPTFSELPKPEPRPTAQNPSTPTGPTNPATAPPTQGNDRNPGPTNPATAPPTSENDGNPGPNNPATAPPTQENDGNPGPNNSATAPPTQENDGNPGPNNSATAPPTQENDENPNIVRNVQPDDNGLSPIAIGGVVLGGVAFCLIAGLVATRRRSDKSGDP